ncbi:hypothetical protein [Bradyrhizobium sp. NP1]|uniref:hypothetical protein n=1 Tax=Bradyrhizobium sp. NP1 TaxID=3049772 RepID=UPI0025A65891|nr:hypothetical protein [Bradyrhizobium sp. NP1]WJR80759.1 hypothetical protein QOU61_13670 [Bradyrhizobium sp. NP1]
MDFQQHRPHDAQIARAMLARDRFVLDGFGAERTFHRRSAGFSATLDDHLELLPRLLQLVAEEITLAEQIVPLGDQRRRYRDVARAGCANQGALGIGGQAVRTIHARIRAKPSG